MMRLPVVLIVCLATAASHGAAEPKPKSIAPDLPASWKAGAASVVITPTNYMWMAGYAGRKKPAEDKVQELYAKALALEDEQGQRVVIVTTDLIGILPSFRKSMERRVLEIHRLPPECLLLNASHTHSGPEYRARTGREQEAKDYTAMLEAKLMQAIGEALAKLEPARLTWNRARCAVAMNRRLPTAKGYQNSANPDGPVDHEVPALRVESAAGELRAVLFGYACHNTCLGFYYWHGDYAGAAQECLQAHRPDNFVALFLMGCGGDQNPYPRRDGVVPGVSALELAQQHGRALANAVEMAISVPPRPVRGPIRAAYEEVELEYAKSDRPKHRYPVQVIKLGGDLTMVALGSEVVVDYSLRLKRELAGEAAVWVAGYSNDYTGYIPSLRVLREGGYEAQAGWAESVEERIVGKVHELHRRLK
jgi:neutral ceramidase